MGKSAVTTTDMLLLAPREGKGGGISIADTSTARYYCHSEYCHSETAIAVEESGVACGGYAASKSRFRASLRNDKAFGYSVLRRGLFPAAFHPSLQDQDGGHAVDGLAPFFDRKVGFAEKAVSFGGRQALVPEMDWQLEVLAEIVRKRLNLLGLDAFGARHPQRKTNDDLSHPIIANDAVQEREIIFLVLAVKGVQTLGGDAERIRNRDPNAARSNVEAEDAVGRTGGIRRHSGIISVRIQANRPYSFDSSGRSPAAAITARPSSSAEKVTSAA